MSKHYWGIDLGGTKIEGCVLDENMRSLVRLRIPTEAREGYRHILSRVDNLLRMMADELRCELPSLIGIGTPGRLDRRNALLRNSNTACLNGRALLRDLEETLQTKVRLENDANCFALAESLLGTGRTVMQREDAVAFGVILGTGVGGGIVCNGRVHRGAHGIAGEWGHNRLFENGEACYCGRKGCVETVLSGPALERYYARRSGGVRKSLQEIARSGENDPVAGETIGRLLSGFGRGIAGVINMLDPDILIIGGGVGNVEALYSPAARHEIEKHLFNESLDIPVVRPELGDSAGVFGAALLTAGKQR
ncbi:MAG: ROK family protein [Chlorobium sp.]|nr:ROK family protein [Chlorobium sp.]MCW8815764.1 ROK family protein [Chlorobium sp.]MCW8820024.1 ROK family protein [Ignavibacteriaceae bacterium]